MPRTLTVSGTLSVADDGAVSGSLTITGPGNTAGQPAGTEPIPGTDPAAGDGGIITEPAPGDVPPYAPDVPATEPPAVPQPADPTASPPPGDTTPAGETAEVPAVDPTAAGAEAGASTTTTATGGDTPATADGGPGRAAPAWPGRELRRNDRQHKPDVDIRAWQQAADVLGGTGVGRVDGFFGPVTEGAVKVLQERAGVPVTGVIDETTWALPFTAGLPA